MSLMHDLSATLQDVMALTSDFMKYKVSAESRAIRNHLNQVILWLAIVMLGFLLILVGAGFVIYGVFYQMLEIVEPGAAALILGAMIILAAVIILLVFRAVVTKDKPIK